MKTHTLVVLNAFRYGDVVTIDALEKATGLERARIFNALCRLCAAKQIVRAKRGTYLKAANPPALPPKMSGVWPAKPPKEPRAPKAPKIIIAEISEPCVASQAMVKHAIDARHPLARVWG